MLVIRAEQMRVLSDSVLPHSIEKTMRECFPDECAALGDEGCRRVIAGAIGRGRAFGFLEPQLTAYAALEIRFGSDFATNPEYQEWAAEPLLDRAGTSEDRMQRLRSNAIFYLAKLAEEAAL